MGSVLGHSGRHHKVTITAYLNLYCRALPGNSALYAKVLAWHFSLTHSLTHLYMHTSFTCITHNHIGNLCDSRLPSEKVQSPTNPRPRRLIRKAPNLRCPIFLPDRSNSVGNLPHHLPTISTISLPIPSGKVEENLNRFTTISTISHRQVQEAPTQSNREKTNHSPTISTTNHLHLAQTLTKKVQSPRTKRSSKRSRRRMRET